MYFYNTVQIPIGSTLMQLLPEITGKNHSYN